MSVDTECSLVCEALVREIRDAQRWSAVVEAWEALLRVRQQHQERSEPEIVGLGCAPPVVRQFRCEDGKEVRND